jgi:hypothetical protein
LNATFPTLQSFKAVLESPVEFKPAAEFPVKLNFEATLSFTPSKFASQEPELKYVHWHAFLFYLTLPLLCLTGTTIANLTVLLVAMDNVDYVCE